VSKGPEPAKSATVPDLTGMTPAEAEEALEAVNLVGRAGDSVYDSNVEVGLVVKQSPVANTTVKEGDAVIYNLSKGIESVEVPNVVGSSYYDAESALTERGFQIDVGYESSDEYAEGYVIRQSPTSMADKGTYVTVIVSTGPQLVEVPWVEGYSESVARSMLEDYGFTVNVSHVESREVESGLVIGQDVSGSAQSGATVSIEVSTGPGPSYDGGNPDDQGQGTDQGEGTNTPTTTPAEDTATEGEVTPEG
jgi:serine/threonine-protein kinase